jgi:2-dehydropantoate 2-reductase
MRFAVMGSGGLGCLFGGLLARAGADVTLIARGANLSALRERGLDVTLFGGERFRVDVRATDDPREVGPVDAIAFCVKTYDIEAAARQMLPMIGPDTLVLPAQNGVEAADQIAAIVGADHVVMGVGFSGATLERPGLVVQKGANTLAKFGPDRRDGGRRAECVRDALIAAGVNAEISLHIERELWEKLLIAIVGLGFMTLTRLPLGPTLDVPESVAVVLGLMQEVAAVGRARGVALPDGAAEAALQRLRGMRASNPAMRGSMYFDLVAGKRLEVEAVSGAVVRLGRELGIPTPYNEVVYAGLKPYIDGAPALLA